jgi:asparagine synthase (glutamine-hydrolysing)
MCGLAAIFSYSDAAPGVNREELGRVCDAMASRGPDGGGVWWSADGRVGLGHRRLSILDLSDGGAQPMVSAEGDRVIAFNGEIYNFRQLRTELAAKGEIFRSQSDTEVLLALWRTWGPAGLARLRGMFAFALWDEVRGGMVLARDGFGIKPLYVAEAGGVLRAASQVKALLAGGGVDTSPDPAGHAGFLLWGHVPEPHTLYAGIRAMTPGSWLFISRDGRREEGRFFDVAEEIRTATPRTDVDLAEALADSVAHHLIADVPVGVFLSAGLDSTTITALAARAAGDGERLRTLTLAFDEYSGTSMDEAPLAELTARHYGCRHVTARIPAGDFALARSRILADMDQPSVDGVNVWFVAREAARQGLKVALSGLGGDELFAGYDSFQQLPRLVRGVGPVAAIPGLGRGFRLVTTPWIRRFTSPKWAGLLEWGGSLSGAYLLRRGLFMPWELPEVMDPDMAREGWNRLQPSLMVPGKVEGRVPDRLKIGALETCLYMRNQLLRDADWAGMAHSLEIRVPLVDQELFRAVIGLVAAGRGPGKRDMALCARPALPDEVLNRHKTGFFVPVADWMGTPHLRGWARNVLSHFTGARLT